MKQRLSRLLALLLLSSGAQASSGMWALTHLPAEPLRQHGLQPDTELLRQATVQLPYGTGSFVSAQGLVLTNHHVISECIDALSTAQQPLQQRGFVAASRAAERRCPGMEIQQLQGIDPLPGLPTEPEARHAQIARLEGADCPAAQRCRVVALHGGALMQRYRSRVWSDVRLVMAPEAQAANFGGDDDNFNYQRFAFDFALLRVYENGRPLATPQHYRAAARGLREGDALLVPGFPYRTARNLTLAQLEAERDALLPARLAALDAELAVLRAHAASGAEAARQVADLQATLSNSRKARQGALEALLKPGLLKGKQAQEQQLRASGDDAPWRAAERSAEASARLAREQQALALPMNSQLSLLLDALTLRAERSLPAAQRLPEFQGAAESGLLAQLGGDTPLHAELEALRLRGHIERARAQLGAQHPWVQALREAAATARWAQGSERLALLARSDAELAADADPLLQLAQALLPLRRDFERRWAAEVDQPLLGASEAIAQASFARFGSTQAPDATFTLRLSFGRVQGVTSGGYRHPWQTTFGGLFARADAFEHKPPFDLAPRVATARDRLPARVPLNFIGTPDIVGGNSGSPVLNARHEWVGLAFDGNLDSLAGDYVYDESSNRMVALHQQGIRLALTRIYPAAHLAKEMGL